MPQSWTLEIQIISEQRFTSYHRENARDMLWLSMASSVWFEEFVSLIIVIGKSGVAPCACIFVMNGIAKRVEDVKIAVTKNTHDIFISHLHLYQSI